MSPLLLEVNIETICISTDCNYIDSCDKHFSKYDEMVEVAWILYPNKCSRYVAQKYQESLEIERGQ